MRVARAGARARGGRAVAAKGFVCFFEFPYETNNQRELAFLFFPARNIREASASGRLFYCCLAPP